MSGSSSWIPYNPQGVKGFDDEDDEVKLWLLQEYPRLKLQETTSALFCHIA